MKRTLVLVLALCVACSDDSTAPAGSDHLVVGALLSLTGPGRTLGQTSEAALQLAADDLNAQLSGDGSPTRVSVRVEDTGLDPAQALDRFRTLAGEGVRIFVGPQSSSEVAALKPFADSAGVILLSQGSTASSLSIPDDNVFRLVPDDSHEGAAMVALLAQNGIETVVPLWREDAGNQGLHDAVETQFQAQGGTVTAGDHYPPGTTDFSAQLQAIKSQINDAVAANGDRAVGDYDFYQCVTAPRLPGNA
jgi:branched-chain amino acid transport system substrate-binding protein